MKLVEQSYEILTPISVDGIYELQSIEKAGRTCYKSEDKISKDGESARRFVKMLIERGHEAMIEHGPSLSVKFICSRGVSHEIVRHRLFSFAQESTRYCNYSSGKFGSECTFIIPPDNEQLVKYVKWFNGEVGKINSSNSFELSTSDERWLDQMLNIENNYIHLIEEGWRPEQARDILPNSLKTEIVVTGNYREWRHFFKLRCDKAAHPHMRALATSLLVKLKTLIPIIFEDI